MSKAVKLLEDAKQRYDNIPGVQRALARIGVDISITALYKVDSGKQVSLKPDVIVALTYLLYNGDWRKSGRALEADFWPPLLRVKE